MSCQAFIQLLLHIPQHNINLFRLKHIQLIVVEHIQFVKQCY